MSIKTEAIRKRGLIYDKSMTAKFRRMGNIPSDIIIYFNRHHKVYLLYWKGNRIDEISRRGKKPDIRDVHKMQKHFGVVQHGDHYKNALADMEYRERQGKLKVQEEQDEKTRYMASEIYKYGVKGSQAPGTPSIVVDGLKEK